MDTGLTIVVAVLLLYEGGGFGVVAEPYREVQYGADDGTQPVSGDRTKILGGEEIDFNTNYTFTISMDYIGSRLDDMFCSGSLLQDEWVLTAAHCFDNRTLSENINIGYQSRSSYVGWFYTIMAETVYKHPLYDPVTLENDFALVRLTDFLNTTSGSFQRTPVPMFSGNLSAVINNQSNCFMTSVGRTKLQSDTLLRNGYRKLDVVFMNGSMCPQYETFNDSSHICYMGQPYGGPCHGDEGAPIVCDIEGELQQVGVNLGAGCGNGTMLAARVSAGVSSWIAETMLQYGHPRCPSLPRVKKGHYQRMDATTWLLVCDEGFEPSTALPTLECLRSDNTSLDGRWSSTSLACKRYRCETSGRTFILAYLYEAQWPGRYPAFAVIPTQTTEVNIRIPALEFNRVYTIDTQTHFTFSKAIYGTNQTNVEVRGVSITTTEPVKVLMYHSTQAGLLGEGSLALPTKCASTRYTLYRSRFLYRFSQAVIVATADNTAVTVLDRDGGVQYQGSLDRLEGLRHQAFSLSYVVASEDVVVFTGHECGEAPYYDPQYCGFMMEQVPPDPLLGHTYIVPSFRPVEYFFTVVLPTYPYPTTNAENQYTYWYTAAPDFKVSSNNVLIYNRIRYTDQVVQCYRPCLVYVVSNDRSIGSRDSPYYTPVNVALTPVNQFESQYTFDAGSDGGMLIVTINNRFGVSGLRLNEKPLSNYLDQVANTTSVSEVDIPGQGEFSVLKFPVSQGSVRLSHRKRRATFGLIYYGFVLENQISYAFQMGRKI